MTVQPTSTNVPGALHVNVPEDPGFTPVYGKMSKAGAAQSIGSAATATLTFDTENFESVAGLVDVANERFVVPTAGIYLIAALVRWDLGVGIGDADGWLSTRVLVDGSVGDGFQVSYTTVPAVWVRTGNALVTTLSLSAGDLVTFQVEQETGRNEDVTFAEASIQRVG